MGGSADAKLFFYEEQPGLVTKLVTELLTV